MVDPFLTAAILGGIEKASQNAIRNQNAQARKYGAGSDRLDAIQSQQDIQKRIQQIHLKNQTFDKSSLNETQSINDMLAQYAMCIYIARADGNLTEIERTVLDSTFKDICNRFKHEQVKNELLCINNKSNMDFIALKKYLDSATAESLVSSLSLVEEIANTKKASDIENQYIYKIRKYLTDRTGKNYLTNTIQTNKDMDPRCPGCAATMEFIPYSHRFECPYCGNVKYV